MLTIREANPADQPTLMRIINAAFAVEKLAAPGQPAIKNEERLTEAELQDYASRGTFLLAEDCHPVAAVFVQPQPDVRPHAGFLGLLAVDPGHQRHGLGRRMTAAAEQWLAAHNCRFVELDTLDVRPELAPVYQAMGYRVVSIKPAPCPERFLVPVKFIRWRKDLP